MTNALIENRTIQPEATLDSKLEGTQIVSHEKVVSTQYVTSSTSGYGGRTPVYLPCQNKHTLKQLSSLL